MVYTVIVNGRSYDLPKKTLAIMEEMEEVSKVDSVSGLTIREKFQKLYDFICNLVGTEKAAEILGSDNLEEVDLSEVTITFKMIVDAYDKPIVDYAQKKGRDAIKSLPIREITEVVNAAAKMDSMKQ